MAFYHRRLWNLFDTAATEADRWAFILSAYNGGAGNVKKDMRLSPDSTRWFKAVELKSGRAASAFKENRDYVRKIWTLWVPLYRTF
jgi:soluble lytic murein transglycosylase-like protein